jgi:hypothetical protein
MGAPTGDLGRRVGVWRAGLGVLARDWVLTRDAAEEAYMAVRRARVALARTVER